MYADRVSPMTLPSTLLTLITGTQKLQVLFFYRRLSLDLFKTKAINIITSVTGLAYVALGLTISLSCRPYVQHVTRYWRTWTHNEHIDIPITGESSPFLAQNARFARRTSGVSPCSTSLPTYSS